MALFDVLINIAASTASFESGMQRVEARLGALGDLAKSALEFGGITLTLAGVADAFSNVVDRGENLSKVAARLGDTVESMSQLQYAAQAMDIPFQTLTDSLDRFEKGLSQASDGSGKARQALSDLGIDAKKLAALPLDQQLNIIADRIAALPSPTQQTAFAMRLFSDAGADLVPVLSKGAAGIDDLRRRSDELGNTLGGDAAAQLKAAKDAMTDLTVASRGLWTELVTDVAPAITAIESAITKLLVSSKNLFGAFGEQKGGTDEDKLVALLRQETALSQTLDNLNQITSARQRIGAQGQVQAANAQLTAVRAEIAQLQAQIDAKRKQAAPGASAEDNQPLPLLNFSENGHMLDAFNAKVIKDSQTSTAQVVEDWNSQEAAAEYALDHNLISLQDYYTRIAEINAQFLQPVEVTAKYITKQVQTTYSDMQKYAQSAANTVQADFATFLTDPSISNFRKMGAAWLQTLDKMVADAAAAQVFKSLFSGLPGGDLAGGLGGLLGALFGGGTSAADSASIEAGAESGLNSAFGFANGGSFDVGGSGGTDSQMVSFKATPGEHVQVGGGSGGDIYITNNVAVTSPQVTKSDVLVAMGQTQTSTISKLQDMKRRKQF